MGLKPRPSPRHWLMKSEPSVYSIDDLRRDHRAEWDGVRNYQARNFMRDEMRVGDLVLFYHSNAEPTGVAGVARVSREAYPDPTAFDPTSPYYDGRSKPEDPTWLMVEIEHAETLPRVVTLAELKENPSLADMMVVQRGMRLSVQPVTPAEFRAVVAMARRS